jgi:hypothetical protein
VRNSPWAKFAIRLTAYSSVKASADSARIAAVANRVLEREGERRQRQDRGRGEPDADGHKESVHVVFRAHWAEVTNTEWLSQ